MLQSQCPSCGAPLLLKNAASMYIVCDFCRSLSIRKDMDLEKVGKVADLKEDGSPLQIGTTGSHLGKNFEIIGRIQVDFEAGSWNEWHLDWGNQSAWIGEANGQYMFTMQFTDFKIDEIPAFDELEIGHPLVLNFTNYFAIDMQKGKVSSMAGELPFASNQAYDTRVADFVAGNNKSFATIDYSEEAPIVFIGEYCSFEQLEFKNLREVYGFKPPQRRAS